MEHFNVDFTFFSVNLRSDYPHYNKLAERLSYIWCRNIYYIFMSIFNDLQLTAVIQKRIKKAKKLPRNRVRLRGLPGFIFSHPAFI